MIDIEKAIKILNAGGVVGIPTETVYGLAGSINSEEGINNIFKTKERPFFDPLIVHVSSAKQAKTCCSEWPPICDQLSQKFWPGPLTFILPKSELISDKISSGLETVGIRMPDNIKTLELIHQLGHPIAAPSANKFTKTSPTSAEHVQQEFPEVFVIDGGPCKIGIESTIIGFDKNKILIFRPGMVTKNMLEEFIQENKLDFSVEYHESPIAPGHLKHHYMPKKPLILKNKDISLTENHNIPAELSKNLACWSLPADSTMAARELYGKLRELDNESSNAICIEFKDEQLKDDAFAGIINRLTKAASYTLPQELSNKS